MIKQIKHFFARFLHIVAFAGVFASTFNKEDTFLEQSWNKWMGLLYFSGLLSLFLQMPDVASSEKFRNWMIVGSSLTIVSLAVFVPMHLGWYKEMLDKHGVSPERQELLKVLVFLKIVGMSVFNHVYRYNKSVMPDTKV